MPRTLPLGSSGRVARTYNGYPRFSAELSSCLQSFIRLPRLYRHLCSLLLIFPILIPLRPPLEGKVKGACHPRYTGRSYIRDLKRTCT